MQRYGNQWGIGSERFPAPTQVQMGEGLLRRCGDSWEGGKRSRSLQYLPFFFRGHTMDVCPGLSQVAHVLPGQKSKVWPFRSHPGHTVFSNTGQVGLRSSPHKWPGWPQYAQNGSYLPSGLRSFGHTRTKWGSLQLWHFILLSDRAQMTSRIAKLDCHKDSAAGVNSEQAATERPRLPFLAGGGGGSSSEWSSSSACGLLREDTYRLIWKDRARSSFEAEGSRSHSPVVSVTWRDVRFHDLGRSWWMEATSSPLVEQRGRERLSAVWRGS